MLGGLNTLLIGLGRRPTCAVCPNLLVIDECRVQRGMRMRNTGVIVDKEIGDTITIYSKGDAASVRCVTCNVWFVCGGEPTPSDVKYKLILQDGNVYAVITDGRRDQFLHIVARVVTTDGKNVAASRNVTIIKC